MAHESNGHDNGVAHNGHGVGTATAAAPTNGSVSSNGNGTPAAPPAPTATTRGRDEAVWTFLTNHTHVLICLAEDPGMRLRDVAVRVGITERAVQRIVTDLEDAGVLSRSREGRRNRYDLHTDRPLRHSVEKHRTVGDLLAMVHGPAIRGGGAG